MASLGNKPPSRACVMHFACPVFTIFNCFATYESIKLQGNRLAQANSTECFCWMMLFCENNWFHGDHLAAYGQDGSTDLCVVPEREKERA